MNTLTLQDLQRLVSLVKKSLNDPLSLYENLRDAMRLLQERDTDDISYRDKVLSVLEYCVNNYNRLSLADIKSQILSL